MPSVNCRRCEGTGSFTDRHPLTKESTWCAACGGYGRLQMPNPEAICQRCNGTGKHSDRNPNNGAQDWCSACCGTGYLK